MARADDVRPAGVRDHLGSAVAVEYRHPSVEAADAHQVALRRERDAVDAALSPELPHRRAGLDVEQRHLVVAADQQPVALRGERDTAVGGGAAEEATVLELVRDRVDLRVLTRRPHREHRPRRVYRERRHARLAREGSDLGGHRPARLLPLTHRIQLDDLGVTAGGKHRELVIDGDGSHRELRLLLGALRHRDH
eukprot:2074973-Prymnesium_polylepis.2